MSYQDFPPALMILSPRLTKAGGPGSSVVGINTTPLADGAIVYCLENKLAYRLDKTSTAAPDGNLVLAPSTGPGRWLADVAPSPSGALPVGYDALTDHITLGITGAVWTEMPRNGSFDPMRVSLTGLTPGNTLEVSWYANFVSSSDFSDVRVYAVIAFNNPTPSFPGDFTVVGNSGGGSTITATSAQLGSLSALAAVPIPVGATSAIVGLMYQVGGSSTVEAWGTTDMFAVNAGTGISLKVEEKLASAVQQPGPGTTSTAIPP